MSWSFVGPMLLLLFLSLVLPQACGQSAMAQHPPFRTKVTLPNGAVIALRHVTYNVDGTSPWTSHVRELSWAQDLSTWVLA